MATIRAYTTIEQSRKLAKILPLESADMCYNDWTYDFYDGYEHTGKYTAHLGIPKTICGELDIPCWSLAALLSVLPILDNKHAVFGTSIKESKWHVVYHNIDTLFIEDSGLHSNLVDACVAMIEKLHELKML